jgi:hypothetical protein
MYTWATVGSAFQITGRGQASDLVTTRDSPGPRPGLGLTIGHALIIQGLGNIYWGYAVANNVRSILKFPNTATKYIHPSKEKPEVTAMITNISNPTPV